MKTLSFIKRQNVHLPLLASFALLIVWLLLRQSAYSIVVLSAATAFALSVILSITGYRPMMMLLILSLPLSVNLAIPDTGSEIRMPSEFLMVVIAGSFIIQKLFNSGIDKKNIKASCYRFISDFYLSAEPYNAYLVNDFSFDKNYDCEIAVFLVFYLTCVDAFLKSKKDILLYYILYACALSIAVIITLYNHSAFDFNKNFTSQMSVPFYADHTIYSACIAFMIPLVIMIAFNAGTLFNSGIVKLLFLLISLLFLTAIFFSASRAAWLSLVAVVVATVLIWLRIKSFHLVILTIIAIIFALMNFDEIAIAVKTNRNDSKKITADFETQAKSITNITSDNSNAERLNRWKCAVRMVLDKPVTGFGPGTYQFQYLSYQKPEDMTPISVTAPYNIKKGRGGTTHNELLLVLSESGWIAMILFLVIILYIIHCGANALKSASADDYKIIAAVLLAFISYVFHSMFNNFLDTDKAAFLFYSAIAALVSYHIQSETKRKSEAESTNEH